MKQFHSILIGVVCLVAAVILSACGAKRAAVSEPVAEPEPEVPKWHTCLIQGARATARINDDKFSANATMQVVRDSMLIISVTHLFGLEIMRLEATPWEIIGIDKLHGRYARTTYAELNRKLTPSINWDTLQQLCSEELPMGSGRARLLYTFGNDVVELEVNYPATRQTDLPLRMASLPLIRYNQVDISRWL